MEPSYWRNEETSYRKKQLDFFLFLIYISIEKEYTIGKHDENKIKID